MISLANQTAVVSGGSRGIGASTAILLGKAGANVAIIYSHDRRSAESVVNRLNTMGVKSKSFRGNVEKSKECSRIVHEIKKTFGGIDILVNCAGIWEFGEIGKMKPEQWQKTIDINLGGTFNLCNLVAPIMKKRSYGKIINLSSTAGQRGESYHSHYAASKGGIIAFTKSISVELIKFGIWVNCVAPGWVDTDMVKNVLKNPKVRKEIIHSIPRGMIPKPEDIAGPILFLASPLSDHIVGEVLNVNGGSVLCG
jgi:3-oxoacyl-[acyl-carrier protein] reductase